MTSRKRIGYWSEAGLDGIFSVRAIKLWFAFGIGGGIIGAVLAAIICGL